MIDQISLTPANLVLPKVQPNRTKHSTPPLDLGNREIRKWTHGLAGTLRPKNSHFGSDRDHARSALATPHQIAIASATHVKNTAESRALADACQESELTIEIPIATKLKDRTTQSTAHRHGIRLKGAESTTIGPAPDHRGIEEVHTIGIQQVTSNTVL
jgi:hypothetical protein